MNVLINNYWIQFLHGSKKYEGQGLWYLPKPKAEEDNINRQFVCKMMSFLHTYNVKLLYVETTALLHA